MTKGRKKAGRGKQVQKGPQPDEPECQVVVRQQVDEDGAVTEEATQQQVLALEKRLHADEVLSEDSTDGAPPPDPAVLRRSPRSRQRPGPGPDVITGGHSGEAVASRAPSGFVTTATHDPSGDVTTAGDAGTAPRKGGATGPGTGAATGQGQGRATGPGASPDQGRGRGQVQDRAPCLNEGRYHVIRNV